MPKCDICENTFPNRVKINGETKVVNTRKFCLDCSPYDQHNTTDPRRRYKCWICGEDTASKKRYGNKNNVCAECHNTYTIQKRREKRAFARELLGGKCFNCSFDKYQSCLDVHHLDPTIKDSEFHGMGGWSLKRIEKELKSCVLLCKICHTAYHNGELEIYFS